MYALKDKEAGMTSSVSSFNAATYLNALTSGKPLTLSDVANTTASSAPAATSAATTGSSTASSTTGSGGVPLPSYLLSLLQDVTGSGSEASALLGGGSTSSGGGLDSLLGASSSSTNPFAGTVEASLITQDYAAVLSAAYANLAQTAAQNTTGNATVQNALAEQEAGLAAANPTTIGGSTSLVA